MKTNIKMRVTPEQSMKVQNIVIANLTTQNKVATTDIHFPYIVISTMGAFGTRDMEFYKIQNYKEIDADLFIRTNGICEETFKEQQSYNDNDLIIKDDNIHIIGKVINKHNDINTLEQKLKKKNEILKKARIKRKNQREELHKLNLKLQKCISLEEHTNVITVKNNVIKELENENYLNKSKLHLSSLNNIEQQKEIEKLKAVIEYLESKTK